jgi:hypothetical protein
MPATRPTGKVADTSASDEPEENGGQIETQDDNGDDQPSQADWQARAQAAEDALAKLEQQAPTRGDNLPPFFLVRMSHPDARKRIIFRSVSEKRARAYLTRFFPRGSEAYLELPGGTAEHHEMERAGEYGTDVDVWAEFDPESYRPPSEQVPPGESAWADREG